MRNRNTRIIMGILVGLVLFTSSVALLLYMKQSKANTHVGKDIEVYVATKTLKKGDYIDASSIQKTTVAQSYISFAPLKAQEIVGKYAAVNIFPKEPIRPEKLATTNPLNEKSKKAAIVLKDASTKHKKLTRTDDTIAIPLSIFKNRDSSLRAGNFVDIVSVVPKQLKNRELGFTTKYIAIHVPVNSFISKNVTIPTYTRTLSVTSAKDKVTTTKVIEADTIVLDMSPKDIKNFLALYYKTQALNDKRAYNTQNYGGQLWLINAATNVDEEVQKQKEKLLLDRKRVIRKKRVIKHQQRVSIAYEK